MRPVAGKLPFCPSVAGELKPFDNTGSSPLILTLFLAVQLCGLTVSCCLFFVCFFLRHQAAALSSQIIRVFASSLSWEEGQWSGPTAPARGCGSGQLPCPSVSGVPAGAGQEGRWLSKSISFWISGLKRARPGITWFSPPLQLALPRDPLFESSGDTVCSLHHLEKWQENLQIETDP